MSDSQNVIVKEQHLINNLLGNLLEMKNYGSYPGLTESDTLELESIAIDVLRSSTGNSDAHQILGIDALV